MDKPHETTGPAAALAHAWGQYRVWANTSRRLKKELTRWRTTVLVLTVLGAVLGVLSSQIGDVGGYGPWSGKVLAFLSAVAIGLAAFFSREALSPEREHRWVTARSMAEACKSECLKFATGTPPYHGPEAWKNLLKEIDELEQTMEGVLASPISEAQRMERRPAMGMPAETYLKERVRDQIGYYDQQARQSEALTEWGKRISWLLGALGVMLGAAGSIFGVTQGGAWVAVTANLTVAVTSYLFAGRFQYLAVSYRITGDRLRSLEAGWRSQASDRVEDFHDFVRRCEEVISIENKRWMAEWTKKKKAEAAPAVTSVDNG